MVTEQFKIKSPAGNLAAELLLPQGFDPATDRGTLVITMHGFLGAKDKIPMDFAGQVLIEGGFPVLRFDFDGYGQSDGAQQDNTVPRMVQDAKAVWDYATGLPFAEKIVILAHSQGGVVAGILAGMLQEAGTPPSALILLAPASILRDFARRGRFFTVRCNPDNPPEILPVYGFNIGRQFILTARSLPIEEKSSLYTGPVCLLHGNFDLLVPISCSHFYSKIFRNSEFHPIFGSGHLFLIGRRKQRKIILNFLRRI